MCDRLTRSLVAVWLLGAISLPGATGQITGKRTAPTMNPAAAPQDLDVISRIKELLEQDSANDGPLDPEMLQEAIQALEQAVEDQPDDFELRAVAADFHMRFRQFNDAIGHLEFLVTRAERRQDTDLQVKLARCYCEAGKLDMGRRLLKQLVGFDDVTLDFRIEEAIAPHEVRAYSILAAVLVRDQQPELAMAVVNQMVEANDQDHLAYLARGSYLGRYRQPLDALPDLECAVGLAPIDEVALRAAGEWAFKAKQFEWAETMFQRLLEVNPNNISAYLGLSRCAVAEREFDAALKFLSDAGQISPDDLLVLWYRTNLHLQMGAPDKAEEFLQSIVTQEVAPWIVHFAEGRIALAREEWSLAAEKLNAAQAMVNRVQPEWSALLQLNLATCYEKLEKHESRIEILQQLLDQQPGNLAARLRKAEAHVALGQVEEAIDDYETCREAAPENLDGKTLERFLDLEIFKQQNDTNADPDWTSAERLVRAIGKDRQVRRSHYAEVLVHYFSASGQEARAANVRKIVQAQLQKKARKDAEEDAQQHAGKTNVRDGVDFPDAPIRPPWQ
jgi:tetratricopeptide (TPR) repeat protein